MDGAFPDYGDHFGWKAGPVTSRLTRRNVNLPNTVGQRSYPARNPKMPPGLKVKPKPVARRRAAAQAEISGDASQPSTGTVTPSVETAAESVEPAPSVPIAPPPGRLDSLSSSSSLKPPPGAVRGGASLLKFKPKLVARKTKELVFNPQRSGFKYLHTPLTDLSKENETLSRQNLRLQLHLPHMITDPEEDEVAVALGVVEAGEMTADSGERPLQRPVLSRWEVLKRVCYFTHSPPLPSLPLFF